LKNFVKIFAPSHNIVDLCKILTHPKYFFCNGKIAMVQALQSFYNLQKRPVFKALVPSQF
jgi:hypothetical protein